MTGLIFDVEQKLLVTEANKRIHAINTDVSTEMSLHIQAYNMKRVMNIMGSVALMKAMAT